MPKYIGQTDKVLRIQLPSSIVDASWGLSEVAFGGRIPLEVQTHWVADDSDIQITIKDLEGNSIEVLKGKVNSSVFLTSYQVKKSNATGGMFFEVEMKAHKLKAVGPKVRVWPAIKITPRLLDGDEKVIPEIEDTKDFTFEAKVQGAPNGSECHFELAVRKSQNHQMRIVGLVARVKDGNAICHWGGAFPKDESIFENKAALSKKAENYEVPKYVLIASCMGVKAESAQIPYSSWVEFDFGGRKGKATLIMPDGTEKVKPVSETGILRVDKPKAGQVRLKKFEHEMEEVRVAAVEDEEEKKHVGMGDLKEVERQQDLSDDSKKILKKGDQGDIVEELNIRLAGFGGGVPRNIFDLQTEADVKQFQKDYMGQHNPTGKLDLETARSIDTFSSRYPISLRSIKCNCGSCSGFGNSKIYGDIKKKEFPGMHRSIVWAFRGALFYLKSIGLELFEVSSGYRCWVNNEKHKRTSTNHMGKAVDFTVCFKDNDVLKKGGLNECDKVRALLTEKIHAQTRWNSENKFSLEPSTKSYPKEFIATNWVHLDVRKFQKSFLADQFFCKNESELNGSSFEALLQKRG